MKINFKIQGDSRKSRTPGNPGHGHVERKSDADWVRSCSMIMVEGTAPVCRLTKRRAEHSIVCMLQYDFGELILRTSRTTSNRGHRIL